jgi:hypothetical protein
MLRLRLGTDRRYTRICADELSGSRWRSSTRTRTYAKTSVVPSLPGSTRCARRSTVRMISCPTTPRSTTRTRWTTTRR